MMKTLSWRDLAIGLVLGAALSFVLGCVYAYAVWAPPSNDWGNEKTTTTILLTPVLLVVLGVLWWLRKLLRRLLGRALGIGRSGLIGFLIGTLALPVAELGLVGIEWSLTMAKLPFAQRAVTTQLADFGAQLKQADAVVLESPLLKSPDSLDWLLFRLAALTGKPVFAVYDMNGGRPPLALRQYRIGSGPACPPMLAQPPGHRKPATSGDSCLIGTDIADFADWPAQGLLLSIDIDSRQLGHTKRAFGEGSLIPGLVVAALQKPAALPQTPYAQPYDPDAQPRTIWETTCFIKPYGPFPFGRGVHWQVCTDLLDLIDVADRIFGPGPTQN